MRRLAFTGLVAAFIALTTISCNKTEKVTPISDKAVATISSATSTCATYTVDLMTPQDINVGTVTVENDAETLFVTYTTTDGWMMKCSHLYVGSLENTPTNGPGNPVAGHFPLHQCYDPMVNTATYEIPLNTLDSCFIVAAQAEVSQVVDGNIVDSQTAWGDGTPFADRGNCPTYFDYCFVPCGTATEDVATEETCYEDAIAWADGETIGTGTNCWCTYVAYSADLTTDLIANQNMNAGKVSFSAATDGFITITINLADGWKLMDITNSVKIEGDDSAPTVKPTPRDFTTYKGSDLIISVPAYNYYFVHLNLQYVVPCK